MKPQVAGLLEMSGQVPAQALDGALQALLEDFPLAGGQADQKRLVGVVEIVQIDKVGRRDPGLGLRKQKIFHQVGPAKPRFARHVDIVFQARDGEPHFQGLAGAGLEQAGGVHVVADVGAAQDFSRVWFDLELADLEFRNVFH